MEWIKVTDRLPKKEGLYNVHIRNEYMGEISNYSSSLWYDKTGKYFFEANEDGYRNIRKGVQGWMPLPEHPKE